MSLSADELTPLRRYLPSSLLDALRAAPTPETMGQALAHLSELLDTTNRHLPAFVVEQVLRDPTPGQAGGQFITGTLLFADISGFTAMSESLSRVGREGAEEVTGIINRYFGVMLTIMRDHAGQLIKFGGDALLALFLEPDSATRAVQAAAQMQAAMAEFTQTKTSQGTFPLQMKVGIRKGRFFAAQLGTAEGMQYALFGADVNATAEAESAALAGQVLVDRATRAELSVPCLTTPVPGHEQRFVIINQIEPPAAPTPLPSPTLAVTDLKRAVALLDALTPYLPAGLLARVSGLGRAATLEGEHRLVAVLFANIHGLGEMADRLGPGRETEIVSALNRYFTVTSAPIQKFGGVINKIDLYDHGDKLMVFFGAPVAHEDDAERAVRAALEMQAALTELSTTLPAELGLTNLRLSQNLGLSYNYVFAGYVGAEWQHEYTVMGDEVNLSARLMSVAEPGTVTVSTNIRRKVQALFDLTPHGTVKVKGKSAPIPIFIVNGSRAIPETAHGLAGMRSPLVGRAPEWNRLGAVVGKLRAGQGQIVSVMGEAGLGKSRLAAELRQRLTQDSMPPARWIDGRCLSYTESVSYYPMLEVVRQLFRLQPDDSDAQAWNKIRERLRAHLSPAETQTHLPYLVHFLNLPLDDNAQEKVRYLDAEALQRRTFIALRAAIEAQAKAAGPLVIALDDIHWLDQASESLLEYLFPLVEHQPILFLLLYRPEKESACWRIHEKAARDYAARNTVVELNRLSSGDSAQLLSNLVHLEPWPPAIEKLILERTEGNPLYLEELLRAFIDGGLLLRDGPTWRIGGNMENIQVPDTLEGVMMTRLDRLDEASRQTAQVASVIGRLFPFDVLTHVVADVTDDVTPRLARLQQQEIAREAGRLPELVYMFRHGMMQEVCYGNLLARTRRQHHRKIAAYLEASQGQTETSAPLIAHHAFVGQDWPRALQYQIFAGQRAQKLFANHEAVDHFTKALQCADNLPADTVAEQRQTILLALGELLTTTGQYERAVEYLTQARTLAQTRTDADAEARACRWLARLHELKGEYPPALEWIQSGLFALDDRETAEAAQLRLIAGLISVRQGEYRAAIEQCQRALAIAQMLGEVTALARANNLLGLTELRTNGSDAIDYFRRAHELYHRAGDIHGQATASNLLANAYLKTGQWAEAEQSYQRARGIFDQMGDLYNRAFADNNLAEVRLKRGDVEGALAHYQTALTSMEQIGGSAYVLGALRNNLGATFLRRGEPEAAREHLRASQQYFEQAQARDFLPELRRHWAEAALLTRELDEAEAQIRQALALARELEARGEEGNSLRVWGQVLAERGAWAEAETQLRASMAVLNDAGEEYESARSQLALAEVCARQKRAPEARAALEQCAPVFQRLEAALELRAVQELLARL